MHVEDTALPEVKLITPRRFQDARGHFAETWNARAFAAAGIACDFVQDNHSLSRAAGTVRGLHFQAPPHAQAKLVRCVRGRVRDVAVDIRRGSPRYGRWVAVELSAATGAELFVPAGFLHGFATLEEECEVVYKCSDYYAPAADAGIRFDDPGLGIDWGLDPATAVLSEKDAALPGFAGFESPFVLEPSEGGTP
jgi:dTDP-4-dehydrorhamnose 3,5-epimerase